MSSENESPGKLSEKRKDYITWEDYFMATAFLAAKRSKDPSTQVGACIVSENNVIVGVGYNGFPKGCDDDKFPWGKNSESHEDNKYYYDILSFRILNAVYNGNSSDIKGCRMYVALFPCNECAKLIIQSGITEIIYMSDKHRKKEGTKASKKMFSAVGIKCRQFVPTHKKIEIDFNEINWKSMSQLPPTPKKPRMNESFN